jgi:hypothetical protein
VISPRGRKKAPSAASVAEAAPTSPHSADLIEVISAWPTLPESIKAGIMAMLKTAWEEAKP